MEQPDAFLLSEAKTAFSVPRQGSRSLLAFVCVQARRGFTPGPSCRPDGPTPRSGVPAASANVEAGRGDAGSGRPAVSGGYRIANQLASKEFHGG
jgi:hypothetical protein